MTTRKQKIVDYLRLLSFKRAAPGEQFTLASGKKSDYFVDVKQVLLRPHTLNHIVESMCRHFSKEGEYFPEEFDGFDAVAGVPFGGTLLSTAFSLHASSKGLYIPQFLVRKEAKGHGTGKQVERPFDENPEKGDGLRNILLLEDVATTGGSAIQAVDALEEAGYRVPMVFVVVDREEGAKEALAARRIRMESLVKVSDL